ncbi:hypothetical protein Bca52824_036697 [Brassica carinata]|uniref:Uncharacterized protein n=1 Tax=Brassica carinata TaxID=52824 RepID=A0A8X7V1S4_BRACI|nr:hypothetical protein Bca52824_036697 [Brassica carinata]
MRPPRGAGSFREEEEEIAADAEEVDVLVEAIVEVAALVVVVVAGVTKDLPAKSLVRFLLLVYWLFSIKMMEGIVATSYSEGDKFYIDPLKLFSLARFLPQSKGQSLGGRGGRGGRGPPGREAEDLLLVVAEAEVLRGVVEDSPEAEGEHSNLHSLSL